MDITKRELSETSLAPFCHGSDFLGVSPTFLNWNDAWTATDVYPRLSTYTCLLMLPHRTPVEDSKLASKSQQVEVQHRHLVFRDEVGVEP